MVGDGKANCDKVFDTTAEMANKSRFLSVSPQRRICSGASILWKKFDPMPPAPTEADMRRDDEMAQLLQKEEEAAVENDVNGRRSVRASSRTKSSNVSMISH